MNKRSFWVAVAESDEFLFVILSAMIILIVLVVSICETVGKFADSKSCRCSSTNSVPE